MLGRVATGLAVNASMLLNEGSAIEDPQRRMRAISMRQQGRTAVCGERGVADCAAYAFSKAALPSIVILLPDFDDALLATDGDELAPQTH